MNTHEKFMHRCLQLAQSGLGRVAPNPMVGCVIVHDGLIIGEGFHHEFGQAHAEVNAINSVKDVQLLSTSALYVNLEPCAHHGKTPPCADLIIDKKIPEVYIGCTDVFEKVNGEGIKRLQQHGIKVVVNLLNKESLNLNKRFFTFHNKKRPYVILKWAQSADGYIAGKMKSKADAEDRTIQWLSNINSRTLVHKWRSEEQAIMIGTQTALTDNPKLDVRLWKGKNPLRIVIDKNLRLPVDLNIFKNNIPTVIFTAIEKRSEPQLKFIKIDFDNMLESIMQHLFNMQIQSVIVEGGRELLQSFIDNNIWDEARVFTSDLVLQGGVKAPNIAGVISEQCKINNDVLDIIYNS